MTNKRKKKIDYRKFGFRKQFSIIDAISKLTSKILDGFKRKEKTAAISCSIEKAYDKINRNKIFERLENMGIQGQVMIFIRELISDRGIKVRIVKSTSHNKQTDMGIPQGEYLV